MKSLIVHQNTKKINNRGEDHMSVKNYLAFDLGASSGRLMRGRVLEGKIVLSEIHRFPNAPVRMGKFLYWDIPYLYREMKDGLKKAALILKEEGEEAECIGIDTWGVDYGYIGEDGSLVGFPFCYRDEKNQKAMEECPLEFAKAYQTAGLQQMNFNTAYQLWYDVKYRPEILKAAKTLLFLPDLLAYFLTGVEGCEYTIASTGMLLNAKTRDWEDEILEAIGFPKSLLPKISQPGELLGTLTKEVQEETGLGPVKVAYVGSHDTASALAGIPFTGEDQAFLSSGTWSLLGLEIDDPIITDASCEANYTNEGSVGGKIKFLKNISGLWVIQQLRKEWKTEFPVMIEEATPFIEEELKKDVQLMIDPDEASFTAPLSMETAVREYLKKTGQREPSCRGEVTAAVYLGLTEKYRQAINMLEKLSGKTIPAIHMVGGGIQDKLLCTLTMKKTGKTVVTGPIEGAAFGNILMQQIACDEISSLEEGRKEVADSVELSFYRA